ncbi:MAG: hypothetical protein ACK4TI_03795, partial [Nitrososphaerales archaeon]
MQIEKEEVGEVSASEVRTVLHNLRRSRTATFGLKYVVGLVIVAILSPVISPFDTYAQ